MVGLRENKKRVVAVLLVFAAVLSVAGIASAAVISESSPALTVTVDVPEELKENSLNYVTMSFRNAASYPISARVVVVPGHVVLNPEWFSGVDAMRDGTGVTFTLLNIPAGGERIVRMVVPGDALENVDAKEIALIKEIKVYPFAGSGAQSYGIESKNLYAMTVRPPAAEETSDFLSSFMPAVYVVLGAALVYIGSRG